MQNKMIQKVKTDEIFFDELTDLDADVISDYIIKKYEKPLLLKILKERYEYLTPWQKRYVLDNKDKYAACDEIGFEARKRLIKECIYKYLEEGNSRLYLEGFVIFRLKKYESILEELAERIIDDRVAEREYEEFIRLLKYFVSIQENRPPAVNVLVRAEGVYELFDSNGRNITKKCLMEFLTDENEISEVNFDDLLISMLITLAPKKIIVHGSEKITNKELFLTIERVFEGEVVICKKCSLCKP